MKILNFTTTGVTKYIIIRFRNSTSNISFNYYRFNKKKSKTNKQKSMEKYIWI